MSQDKPNPHTLVSIPEKGSRDPVAIYNQIKRLLSAENSPEKNFASFVNVSMEEEAIRLALETLNINLADQTIYHATHHIQTQILHMTASMLHADFEAGSNRYIGSTTVGSSEGVMLGVLAHKTNWQRWRDQRQAINKPLPHSKPNMVVGGAYQICWEKGFKFFDIDGLGQAQIIPLETGKRIVTARDIERCIRDSIINEQTAVIGLALGNTLTGETDEIVEINDLLRAFNDERELLARKQGEPAYRIPIHIDAAYGGFILPFTEPDFKWDFRASEVQSINVSNHKYGMVFPGLGSVIFRHAEVVPKELFSEVNYLGERTSDYTLNFSRPSFQVICQYYNFLRFGREGYRRRLEHIFEISTFLVSLLTEKSAYKAFFTLLSEKDSRTAPGRLRYPNLVFKVNHNAPFSGFDLSQKLSERGWTVPAYTLPANLEDETVIRLVIKENVNAHLAIDLMNEIGRAIDELLPIGQLAGAS